MTNYLSETPFLLRVTNFISLICILVGSILIGSAVFLFVLKALLHVNFTAQSDIFLLLEGNPAARNYLLISQGATSIVSFIIIPLVVIYFLWPTLQSTLYISSPNNAKLVLASILLVVACVPLIAYLSEWNRSILNLPEQYENLEKWMVDSEKQAEKLTTLIAYYHSTAEFWTGLLVIALLPAIGEELLFRGVLQGKLTIIFSNHHLAIFTSSFLFSFIHFQFFGFLPRMFLGMLFGYVFYWSGNLLYPVIMHFIQNAATYVVLNQFKKRNISIDLESVKDLPVASLILSVAFCVLLMLIFKRLSTRKYE